MKKTKLSVSELRLLILLVALLVLACSYFFVFTKKSTEASEIETSNMTLSQNVQKLEMMVAREADVEKETAQYNATIDEILAKYPSDMTIEKAIYTLQQIEEQTGAHFSNISILQDNLVGEISSFGGGVATQIADTTADTTATDTTTDVTVDATTVDTTEDTTTVATTSDAVLNTDAQMGFYYALSLNYEVDYAGFKNMVKYVNEMKDRTTIPAVSISYDSTTGKLSGVITLNMYYLTNTDKTYVEPQINGISTGVNDIFQSGGGTSATDGLDTANSLTNTDTNADSDETAGTDTNDTTTNDVDDTSVSNSTTEDAAETVQ